MQASGLLQRFPKKGALCDGNSFPPGSSGLLGIQHVLPHFAYHSSTVFTKEARQFLKKEKQTKKKERTKRKEDDRDHYKVSFMETTSPWGASVMPELWCYTRR